MDDELRDEMERRGDSLLEEERWGRGRRLTLPATQQSFTVDRRDGVLGVRIGAPGYTVARFSMDNDIAVQFANAILSEIEIAERTEKGEFDG